MGIIGANNPDACHTCNGGSNPPGTEFQQNNIAVTISAGYFIKPALGSFSMIDKIVQKLNGQSFTITEIQTPVCVVAFEQQGLVVKRKYKYIFKPGKGKYGIGGTPITAADLEYWVSETFTDVDAREDPNTIVVDLGDLPTGDYLTAANGAERDFNDLEKRYFVSYTKDGVGYLVMFVGVYGYYGGTYPDDFTAEDFVPTYDTTMPPNIVYTSQLINDGANGLDPFATVAEVNGMDIIVDQAAAEMYLKNNEGVTLATVSLAFLNNEGTTFFYNTTTKNLELKNEAGEVLSVVPVSAFVSNLIQSVNFNGATPSVLEFKDSTGTVVSSVTFTINNIAGLQAILDLKAPLANPAFSGVPTAPTAAINDNTLQIANAAFVQNVANSKVGQTIIDGVTASAPSQNAVYDNIRRWVGNTEPNLNNFMEAGSFLTSAPTLTNLPTGWAQGRHMMLVSGSIASNYCTQIITNLTTGLVAFRKLNGTDWSGWVEYADKSKTLTQVGNIPAGANLDTYQTTGIYFQLTNANAASGTNYPAPLAGKLEVVNTTDGSEFTYQTYHTYASNNDVYLRTRNGAVWYGWVKLSDAVDLDLKADKNRAFPVDFSLAINSAAIPTGVDLNAIPKGTYSATVSTGTTNKPFVDVGALISLGESGIGGQLLFGRTSRNVWYRGVNGAFDANWRKLVDDLDLATKQNLLAGSQSNIIRGDGTERNKDLFVFLDTVLPPSGYTPVNTAIVAGDTASAIASKAQGQLNNKADLVAGKILAAQLPSYVDDVLEYANLAAFPASGESGKLYIAIDSNLVYRWGGSSYVVTSSSLALGETISTAHRGDHGKTAYDHSQLTGNPHGTTIADISGLAAALSAAVRPYKVYSARIAQSGTSAPVATVQENTIEEGVVWARGATGQYSLTFSSGKLTANKTIILPIQTAPPYTNHAATGISGSQASIITTSSGGNTDGLLSSSYSFVEIRVYN